MIALAALALAAAAGPLERCDPPPGWDRVEQRQTRYVLFGETHGTREAPAFVGDVACALAFRGERLLVAIEQDATSNAALQAAWALTDDHFAAALLRFWPAGRQDGVGSEAMFALLVRLHRLRAGGRLIDVVAFNGARDAAQAARFAALPGQGPHEAAQAENIREADAGRYDHVLVLTGSLHARKQLDTIGGTRFEPMAMKLAPAGAETTLRLVSAGGSSWSCGLKSGATPPTGASIPFDMIECGPHSWETATDLHRPSFVQLGAVPGDDPDPAYDGFVWLGRVTASAPAVPARKTAR